MAAKMTRLQFRPRLGTRSREQEATGRRVSDHTRPIPRHQPILSASPLASATAAAALLLRDWVTDDLMSSMEQRFSRASASEDRSSHAD